MSRSRDGIKYMTSLAPTGSHIVGPSASVDSPDSRGMLGGVEGGCRFPQTGGHALDSIRGYLRNRSGHRKTGGKRSVGVVDGYGHTSHAGLFLLFIHGITKLAHALHLPLHGLWRGDCVPGMADVHLLGKDSLQHVLRT